MSEATTPAMVERVARAIAGAHGGYLPLPATAYLAMARAAIESMLEPTEEMMDILDDEFYDIDDIGYYESWRAMLTAALGKSGAECRAASGSDRP